MTKGLYLILKGKNTLVKNKLQGEHPKQILYNLTFKIVKVSTKADMLRLRLYEF